MSVQRIAAECWNRIEPFWLCVLPWTCEEFERRWDIGSFDECEEDGLGLRRVAVLRIGGTIYLVDAYPNGSPGAERVHLSVADTSHDSRRDFDNALAHLCLDQSELLAIQPELGPARWWLWRVDDHGNEFEMARFQSRGYAEWVRTKYAAKGHKQLYYVRDTAIAPERGVLGEAGGYDR
ncbi:hypothetical protein IEQ11_25590 [Lysobacter capsici]|uniref:hypothetical protein n=1 Tax=Lysobacter capsici TaxID=435897 RepID=UPI001E42D543|nr:hypothetical protein [Lysobacter capsici]UOF15040.1 hypothetical protein IEQ11_25590 [Lysobacter capsici]